MRLISAIVSIFCLTLSVEAVQKPGSLPDPSQKQLDQNIQEQLQQQAIAKLTPQLLDPATASVIGSPSAKHIMIVFIDNNCPACRLFYVNTLSKLMQTHPDLTVFVRQWAILGEPSVQVAKGLLAAHRQKAFAAFHHQVCTTVPSTRFDGNGMLAIAQSYASRNGQNFNLAQYNKDISSGEIQGIIAANDMMAHQIGLNGTPSVLLGTPSKLRLMSSNSYDTLNDALHLMGSPSVNHPAAKT